MSSPLLKLNLGCGQNKRPGYVNVDKAERCHPDRVVDLERFPWPFDDDSVGEVVLRHVLEHLGATPETYLGIFKELYRVCAKDATVTIAVPHPRSDDFINDPTHVRAVTPQGLELFSKKRNREWGEGGYANTPLGLYLDVDFEIVGVAYTPASPWRERMERKEITSQQLAEAMRMYNNVVREIKVTLAVRKQAPSS
jgi:hypothetical protein